MATRKETGKRKEILAQAIRRDYHSGTLVPGEMLPPVRVLASRYGLSKRVVNDELQKLAEEGWLRTVPRVGIFVRDDPQGSRRILDHAVVVLTSTEPTQPHQNQHQSGWADNVSYGALREIHARGLHSIVLHPNRLCGEVIERLALEQPYGVIIPEMRASVMQMYGEMLRAQGVRAVMLGNDGHLATFDRVSSDHVQGGYLLTKWLLSQGLRHIRMSWINEPPEEYWVVERRQGYERAMQEAGLKPLAPIHAGARDTASLAAALKAYVQGKDPLQAILTPSDGFVSEYAAALRALGTHPNRDVLLCGYDNYWQDLQSLGHREPRPVATIDKLNEATGAEAVRLLLERVQATGTDAAEQAGAKRETMPTAPVHRTTTPQLIVPVP